MPTVLPDLLLADRIWIAVALLHQEFPMRADFSKDEIRRKLDELGLTTPEERKSVNPHLNQHLVANVPPSNTRKYWMLFKTDSGNLRLYRPGDHVHEERRSHRNPKQAPRRDEISPQYYPLLEWYSNWRGQAHDGAVGPAKENWEDDPLIRLIGSGKHIWADEHADEYVENLRREDI